jgi:hypothetical protein
VNKKPFIYVIGILVILLGVLCCFPGASDNDNGNNGGDDDPPPGPTGHNAGLDCLNCHPPFKVGGTVYEDATASALQAGAGVSLIKPDGSEIVLDNTDQDGNFASTTVDNGDYIMHVANISSRTWHRIPDQGACNNCHKLGARDALTAAAAKTFHSHHTQIPPDNDCSHCHHFPASQSINDLKPAGVLNANAQPPTPPGSKVDIGGQTYTFDPGDNNITSVRQDIFAPGFFSMFDVILAVAAQNGITIDYHYDDSRKCHFIDKINNVAGNYWYHFAYDVGTNTSEITYRRAYRWDEALWRPGVHVRVVEGELLDEIKVEYLEEINRENSQGNIIPHVRISINPSDYKGNPLQSHRVSVQREFNNVQVTAHNLRSGGTPSYYPMPFQPEVITSIDILHSLMDQGELDLVTQVFYTYFAQKYIHSFYVVAMGFPGVGTAHHSGRQGFVYTTNNGTYNRLPNNADRKFHITSDISVVHAPDFSYWRWVELGNPYYEDSEPSDSSLLTASIEEDYNAIGRGFNLHRPMETTRKGIFDISFNIFEPGPVDVTVYNESGERITTIFKGLAKNIGIYQFIWKPKEIASGLYQLVMRYGKHTQVRNISKR